MKMNLLVMSAFALLISTTVFAQGHSAERMGAGPMMGGGMMAGGGPGRSGMMGPGRGMNKEMMAQMEFPNEWAALEKQKADLIAKAEEKDKAFRGAMAKYRETKDAAALATIKEGFGKRYDSSLVMMKNRIAEMEKRMAGKQGKKDGNDRAAMMLERMKKNYAEMTKEGKDAFVEKQIKRLDSKGKKRHERKGGKKDGEGKKSAPAQEA